MKILIVNTLYAPNKIGGAEKSVQLLSEKFALSGHKVKVVCLDKKTINYKINNINVKALKIKNSYWPFGENNINSREKFFWHLKDSKNTDYTQDFIEIINEFKPDILFTNNLCGFSTNIWLTAKQLNVKIVHTLRDYYLQCTKSTKFKSNLNCYGVCLPCKALSISKKATSTKVDYLVGISNFILNDHIKNHYFKNVPNEVIYNGFDIKLNPLNKIKNDFVTFGFMGQVKEPKGIGLLLNCLSKFKEYKWKLLIAGDIEPSYLTKLQSINNSSKIAYLGYVKSDDFFRKIDTLIVPSLWHEPFGRVVLESYINKTPVLGADVGGISELMTINKEFLFNPNKIGLTKKLESIILNPSLLNSFNFDENHLNNFSIDLTVKKYLDVFNKLVKK